MPSEEHSERTRRVVKGSVNEVCMARALFCNQDANLFVNRISLHTMFSVPCCLPGATNRRVCTRSFFGTSEGGVRRRETSSAFTLVQRRGETQLVHH